ncbi:MAG: B3/B4 domain-containing protein [Thermoanaerobaculia bacterium]
MSRRLKADARVLERFPGYTALVLYATGLTNGASDAESAGLLREAEAHARMEFGETPAASHPHLQAWRSAFAAFGSKPSKFLCSAEALLKRVLKGDEIPPINRVVDAYNAVSIRRVLPAGGEDLDRLESDLHLTLASGDEPFDLLGGDGSPEHPDPGEVIWRDSAGVTCRRWNWRQCRQTRLTEATSDAYFVIDRLEPYPVEILHAAGEELKSLLSRISPGCELETEILGRTG